jgi:predicted HTH domain antitoxin
MEQVAVTVKIPKTAGLTEFDVTMTLASRLYELGKISSGQAAEMVGLSKRAFIELLGKYNVSIFGYTLEDEDLSTI